MEFFSVDARKMTMTDATASNLTYCRDCNHVVSLDARSCPSCGAPRPARPTWTGYGYEYKSKTTVLGIPLVHIAFGKDQNGKLRVAHGIVAIGQFGRGVICIAQFGFGVISITQFGIGLLAAAGQLVIGAFAAGQFPIALYAFGQVPIALLWAKGQAPILFR